MGNTVSNITPKGADVTIRAQNGVTELLVETQNGDSAYPDPVV